MTSFSSDTIQELMQYSVSAMMIFEKSSLMEALEQLTFVLEQGDFLHDLITAVDLIVKLFNSNI